MGIERNNVVMSKANDDLGLKPAALPTPTLQQQQRTLRNQKKTKGNTGEVTIDLKKNTSRVTSSPRKKGNGNIATAVGEPLPRRRNVVFWSIGGAEAPRGTRRPWNPCFKKGKWHCLTCKRQGNQVGATICGKQGQDGQGKRNITKWRRVEGSQDY